MTDLDPTALFDPLRPKLLRAAYRMLASVADAEDIVQDAFLRWIDADRAAVREPEAFLRSVVTRLCLDHMKSARKRREDYVGLWLPEPVFEGAFDEADDITLPLMVALERLTPLERAAFLLHDVFGLSFSEIAETIDRDPAACRQLASRARVHVRSERTRFRTPRQRGLELAEAFFAASRDGDLQALRAMLVSDVAVYADGGGKVATIATAVVGLEDVMDLLTRLARLFGQERSRLLRYAVIDGLAGFVTLEQGGTLQTTALDVAESKITAIYVTRNPEKLRHAAGSQQTEARAQ
ncbi:sigma-70 family RNA polymerase sigma factor [Mesorhizobium sp. AR07]|uniref:sigma-70 family RNA polymerase sigma factor n=1 Tax=Mesorhizobium sp. AR07 TaxID=2865838 RepID=UPI00215FA752|nr:sigma-70 family RNA polymerase sigma factor [Mesorhizobium sp. AR07]UVK46647.1 sigma-70 family RNA polymerase sigma factor [Mesorhizobium sp. AR07]